jgi:hypothetical protein
MKLVILETEPRETSSLWSCVLRKPNLAMFSAFEHECPLLAQSGRRWVADRS